MAHSTNSHRTWTMAGRVTRRCTSHTTPARLPRAPTSYRQSVAGNQSFPLLQNPAKPFDLLAWQPVPSSSWVMIRNHRTPRSPGPRAPPAGRSRTPPARDGGEEVDTQVAVTDHESLVHEAFQQALNGTVLGTGRVGVEVLEDPAAPAAGPSSRAVPSRPVRSSAVSACPRRCFSCLSIGGYGDVT